MRDLNYYLGLPYTIEIVPDEDYYFARVLELPGCLTYADTLEKLSPMIEDAIRNWIEVSLEDDEDIPEPLQRSDVGTEDGNLADIPARLGHSPTLTRYTAFRDSAVPALPTQPRSRIRDALHERVRLNKLPDEPPWRAGPL